jgi:hypothetical protein
MLRLATDVEELSLHGSSTNRSATTCSTSYSSVDAGRETVLMGRAALSVGLDFECALEH